MQKIETIIFDLGGVLIDLYVEKTISAFSKISGLNESEVKKIYLNAGFFKEYEKGLISDEEFRLSIRRNFSMKVTDDEIDLAWNAMLGGIALDKIEYIKELSQNYNCIVLSNTNAIHEKAFHMILNKSYAYQHLSELFDEVYFSHEVKQRKPDYEIYHTVLRKSKIEASSALFMDDSKLNLETAGHLGIHTLYIPRNEGFQKLLARKLDTL